MGGSTVDSSQCHSKFCNRDYSLCYDHHVHWIYLERSNRHDIFTNIGLSGKCSLIWVSMKKEKIKAWIKIKARGHILIAGASISSCCTGRSSNASISSCVRAYPPSGCRQILQCGHILMYASISSCCSGRSSNVCITSCVKEYPHSGCGQILQCEHILKCVCRSSDAGKFSNGCRQTLQEHN